MFDQNNKIVLRIMTVIVFFSCLIVFMIFSTHRPFWADEYNTAAAVMDNDYTTFLLGTKKDDANNFPLYYMLSKIAVSSSESSVVYERSLKEGPVYVGVQFRIIAILSMAFIISILFYYFSVNFSPILGFYSVILAVITHPTWLYLEARVYPFVMFLTTVQILTGIELLRKGYDLKLWRNLTILNVLLSLTYGFSMSYILGLSFLLWLFVEKDLRKYILMTLIPLLICCFYYWQYSFPVKFGAFFFGSPFSDLLLANFNKERWLIFIVSFLIWGYLIMKKKEVRNDLAEQRLIEQAKPFVYVVFMVVAVSLGLLLMMRFWHGGPDPSLTLPMQFRYIIFLTPVSIIAMTYFTQFLFNIYSKNQWFRIIFLICLIFILIYRGYTTYSRVIGLVS